MDRRTAVPPESWETADLEDSVSRLLISGPSLNQSSSDGGFTDAAPPVSTSPPAAAVVIRGGTVSEEALAQVDQFLREALEKPRERLSVLRMEQDVEKFLRDPSRQELEFKALPTSYLRLAAHRIAQHYFLQSVAIPDNTVPDGPGSLIVLRKTPHCRFPAVRLADIPVNLPQEEKNSFVKFSIKQRPQKRPQAINTSNAHSSGTNKSVEERKEEYNRARERIFSSSGGIAPKSEAEITLPDSFPLCSPLSAIDEKDSDELDELAYARSSGDPSIDASGLSRSRVEKEPVASRNRTTNKVAILRDREVDRKDPDYDRSYERYLQRFDPGFGFSGGHFAMQPIYSPAVSYNTKIPQLGSGHGPQISLEHQQHPVAVRGPWSLASGPTAIGYAHPEGMITPFSPSRIGGHQTSSIYMQSRYHVAPRPGMTFVHPHEHVQHFGQAHQQQPESSFGLARPR